MPDLKLTPEAAAAALERARQGAVDSVTQTAEKLADDLREVAAARALPVPTYDSADVAATFDVTLGQLSYAPQLQLGVGGYGGFVHLSAPPPAGRYRVLLLFTKLPDK